MSRLSKEEMAEILEHAGGTAEILGAIRSLSDQIESDKKDSEAAEKEKAKSEKVRFAINLVVGVLALFAGTVAAIAAVLAIK